MRMLMLLVLVPAVLLPFRSFAEGGPRAVVELRSGERIEGVYRGGSGREVHLAVGADTRTVPVAEVARISFTSRSDDDFGKAARGAVDSLRALRSAVQSGVLYADYLRRLADARIVIDRFLTQAGGYAQGNLAHKRAAPLAAAVNDAMAIYSAAGRVWERQVRRQHDPALESDPVIAACPKMQAEMDSIKTLINRDATKATGNPALEYLIRSAGPSPLLACAAEKVEAAEKVFKTLFP